MPAELLGLPAAASSLSAPAYHRPALALAARQVPTLAQIKYQIIRLMRMLVEVTNTLEQVGAGSPDAFPRLPAA